MNIEDRSAEFWARINVAAKNALQRWQSDSNEHLTKRALTAATFVPEAALRLGLTKARFVLEEHFLVSERMIRRCETIATYAEITELVNNDKVSVDSACKIMKADSMTALTIAWLVTDADTRTAFMRKFKLQPVK